MTAVSYSVDDGIAVLDFGNPPVNALSLELRSGLAASAALDVFVVFRRRTRVELSPPADDGISHRDRGLEDRDLVDVRQH